MMKSYIILFFVFIYSINNANSQTQILIFKLIVAGKDIGRVTATKKIENNKTTYTSNTDALVKFIFSTEIKTRISVIFINDKLFESSFKLYENGKLKEQSYTLLKNGIYTIKHDKETNLYDKNIFKCTIQLLFEQPKISDTYFEEVDGNFKTIKFIKENSYQLISKDGKNKEDYKYNNGFMQYSLVRNLLVDFELLFLSKNNLKD